MKKVTVTIKDNETGRTEEFETNGILGSFINREFEGGSDTSQFIQGHIKTEKELIKLLAGCINMVYFVTADTNTADKYIEVARKVASEGYKQKDNYRKGY